MRNDSACGSTIGPIMATKLGVRTIGKRARLDVSSCIHLFSRRGYATTEYALHQGDVLHHRGVAGNAVVYGQ